MIVLSLCPPDQRGPHSSAAQAPGTLRLLESTLCEKAGWLFRRVGGGGGGAEGIPHLGLEERPEMAALPPGWATAGCLREETAETSPS